MKAKISSKSGNFHLEDMSQLPLYYVGSLGQENGCIVMVSNVLA